MPELPEVETIRRAVAVCIGEDVQELHFNRTDIIHERTFAPEVLLGKSLTECGRRGKYLLLYFAENRLLTIHLGMSGRFFLTKDAAELSVKHVHFWLKMSNGKYLIFYDPRRFGGLWFTEKEPDAVQKLGVEPLNENFAEAPLFEKARKRNIAIKALLLEQTLVAGLGNIYADEALFRAGVLPERLASTVTEEEWERLKKVIPEILQQSIAVNGTTFRDYRDGLNQKGAFQNFLNVYGKEGQPCPKCQTLLQKIRIAGRSSVYCPQCQK